jgi:hypothetical protein
MLFAPRAVKLKAGEPYTLSAWVRSDDPGTAWIGGGSRWQFRAPFKKTGGAWSRVELTFVPEPVDVDITLRIVTEDTTPGIWIDDVALVAGRHAEQGTNLAPNGDFEQVWTIARARRQLDTMESIADRLEQQLADALSGKVHLPEVPRWTGKQRPRIDGPSFVAPTILPSHPNADPVDRPVFFVGYGHFQQVRKDVDHFPRIGVNLVQCGEFGPAQVFTAPDTIDPEPLRLIRDMLDRAEKAGVGVDLLISPHYFPKWFSDRHAADMYKRRQGGFFPYSPYAPQGWEILLPFVKTILEPIKDHPALFSVCLSNEPSNFEEPGKYSLADWHAWLKAKHGKIATLNQRWGTSYTRFEDVPQADPFKPEAVKRPSPAWNDYVRWNQEFFAGWHARLARAVKEVAPNVPVHAKTTTWLYVSERSDIDAQYGCDPLLFSRFSDILGCDSFNHYTFGRGDFAEEFQRELKGYTLLRSVKDAPVFNSENHLITDRDTRPVPPEHVRCALWQAATRGQSATTLWVWERTFDPASDLAGSIIHRPACAEAVGMVSHDLNRLSREVTAFQTAPPEVLVLHGTTASAWDAGRYDRCVDRLMTAQNFTGRKVGFVTERQLEDSAKPPARVIFVPNIVHLSDEAFAALKGFVGTVVLVGDEAVLTRNEYDHVRDIRTAAEKWPRVEFDVERTTWGDLRAALMPRLVEWGVPRPRVSLSGADGRAPAGVEWRCAIPPDGRLLVNVCNYLNSSVKLKLIRLDGQPAGARELIGDQSLAPGQIISLAPLEVRLYELEARD